MKKTLMTIVAIFTCVATISAQENNDRRRERRNDMDLVEIYNRQASRLVKQLKIDDDKEDLFVALYLDYQNTRHNVVNPMGGDQEGNEMRTDFKEISDEQAMEMIQKNFERQEKQLAVDREFLPKFLEILTPQQAAQLFMRPFGRPNNGGRGGDNGPRGGRGGFGGPGGGFGGPGF